MKHGAMSQADGWISDPLLWPWLARFLWSPAHDIHPTRRAALLPGWPDEAWVDPGVLVHVSRQLLNSQPPESVPLASLITSASTIEARICLLPQQPLALLARRMGLALHVDREDEALCASFEEVERRFLTQRAPLLWRTPSSATDFEAGGWSALRRLACDTSNSIQSRFVWKTPVTPSAFEMSFSAVALRSLAQKIIREFDTPWPSLFVNPRLPDFPFRLRA